MRSGMDKQEELREKVEKVMRSSTHAIKRKGEDAASFKVRFNPDHKDEFHSTY